MIWRKLLASVATTICLCFGFATLLAANEPGFSGKLVDLSGRKLHVNCTGRGSPTVIVENGLGDFSFDWILVQTRVSHFARICTYDRAGYAWSEPGPKPRTFAQLNLELRDALARLGERGPFVLVGHSFGGPVIRNFAATYPHDVAGMVLVDSAFEGQRVGIGGNKTVRLGDGARGRAIPPPHENMRASDKPAAKADTVSHTSESLDPLYNALPPAEEKLQLWAQALPEIQDAENSQREWSTEYFAKMLATPQAGVLGKIPLVVLTRAEGGYGNDLDVPGAQLEKERKEGQAKLAQLSKNSVQVFVHSGHNMEIEAPDAVTEAIRRVVEAVRHNEKLGGPQAPMNLEIQNCEAELERLVCVDIRKCS